jgi:hypothetical protein
MTYKSRINTMWIKLSTEMCIKGPAPTHSTFEHMCETLYLAEDSLSSWGVFPEIKSYLAECNGHITVSLSFRLAELD